MLTSILRPGTSLVDDTDVRAPIASGSLLDFDCNPQRRLALTKAQK
jgi:hypothetical protein